MADLTASAEQFAKDLAAMNIAGLMMVFTPNGMMKAMALQGQMAAGGAQAPTTGTEIGAPVAEGDLQVVDIVMKNANGQATLFTKWKEEAGAWKVEDIGVKA
ncbi:MAG: hypothetical protein ACKVVT_00775 [Dehalococcoidia bacterium]